MLRDDRGVPRSLIAYYLLAIAASVAAVIADVAVTVPGASALFVPAAVLAVAVGHLAMSRGLALLRAVCAALVVLLSAVPIRRRPPDRRPPGLADPCRRVEAVLLAGPRAPGVRA
ncbi:hypothetical protein [Gordonia humi]|uniref:Uncharacterized protein n=1 Tax=Gordonia humi TaxID=686429 RepID=A0A840F273_9ACTN|nr:hypothetical protein [Gordonia humi]MBB4133667.1 hypothetical protein [Gordonia humi]